MYLVIVPQLLKEVGIVVDIRQEEIVQEPEVMAVVDVEPMVDLELGKQVIPLGTKLGGNIDP